MSNPEIPIAWRLLSAWCFIFPILLLIKEVYINVYKKDEDLAFSRYSNVKTELAFRLFGLTIMFPERDNGSDSDIKAANSCTKVIYVILENIPQFFI